MYVYIYMYLYLYIFLPKLSWCKANPTQWFPPLRIHCCDYCLQQMGDSYVQDPAGAWAYWQAIIPHTHPLQYYLSIYAGYVVSVLLCVYIYKSFIYQILYVCFNQTTTVTRPSSLPGLGPIRMLQREVSPVSRIWPSAKVVGLGSLFGATRLKQYVALISYKVAVALLCHHLSDVNQNLHNSTMSKKVVGSQLHHYQPSWGKTLMWSMAHSRIWVPLLVSC